MSEEIHQLRSLLNRLKTRKWFQDAINTITVCVIFLEILAIFAILLYGVGMPGFSSVLVLLFLVSALGLFFRRLVRSDSHNPVMCADFRYGLKDRLLTAASILSQAEPTAMERLQLHDAAAHARQVDPREVLPVRLPKYFGPFCTLSILLFMVGLLVASSGKSSNKIPAEFRTDFRETLAALSQREQTLLWEKQALSSEAMETSLAEIGTLLSAFKATQAAGKTLQTGNLALASKELESLEWNALALPEREITSRMLQEVAEKIRRRNLLQLSQLTERLADEILHGNLEAIQEVTAELVAVIQTENQHQKIRRELENKLALLEDQKADLIAAFNGGQGTRPSHTPGQAWGTGEADDPQTGPVTKIDATRQLQWISGRQGMGPSEVETIFSPDGTEEGVTRPYVDVYRRSFRTAETALEFEPIPLRHRQVIRQYFEAVKSME